MPINVDDIVVDFECPECKLTQQTTVSEIIEVGCPICTICKHNPEMCHGDAYIYERSE